MGVSGSFGLERQAIRSLYESALWAHESELAEQVRQTLLDQAGFAPEGLVADATKSLIESLLQAPDEALAAYFGDQYPSHLVPDPDPHAEILRRFDGKAIN